jgi:hypothetical protein
MVKKELKNRITDYNWISPGLIKLRTEIMKYILTIIKVYAPVEGKDLETDEFYIEAQEITDKTKITMNI